MKHTVFLYLLLFLFAGFFSCKESEEERRKKSIEMMTTQTLGLAYLEEFKLEEAENEFLKMIQLAPDEKLGYANLGLVYLRMGKYKEAEEQIFKALKIDPEDGDISLLLATAYQMDGRREEAIAVLQKALETNPGHIKILYDLAELHSSESDESSQELRKEYLEQLVQEAPDNIVPQLQLTELLIKEGHSDPAIERLEILQKQFPEFPKESEEYYNKALDLLRLNDMDKALINFTVFHNYLRVSFPYQSGINELKGPGGSHIGFPLITYNTKVGSQSQEEGAVLQVLRFNDVTVEQGLDEVPSINDSGPDLYNSTHIKAADYDGDGNVDLYVGSYDPAKKSYVHYLFNNTPEGFKNVANDAGFDHKGREKGVLFADYDNDGFLDLYAYSEQGSDLYKNADKGVFENITQSSKISGENVNVALSFDMDNDGDLDLFQGRQSSNKVYRNNGDGSFTEISNEMGLASQEKLNTIDAAFGDFDDDGDVDLVTINENGPNQMYMNKRQGIYEEINDAGLEPQQESSAVVVGDYNNDGFLDMFIASRDGAQSRLYTNTNDGKFRTEQDMTRMFPGIQRMKVNDVEFIDFDNDGHQDILLLGEVKQGKGSGLLLYHNDGQGGFSNVSELLPGKDYSGAQLATFDYDGDGDRDIILARTKGGVSLLRNDGGNLNHYVNMKLVGLRTGSGKNNYFGIGSKVEMRAGELYQSMVVTDPHIAFGLGNRPKADIIRITWTNGVPQNILMPDADQALIESQTLKGSCPFLYTWNGKEYEFVKDITWRSALGMPLGIMGGTTKYAFASASDDYIKIDGDQLKEKDGSYSIQVTSELWETIYMDKIELVAVDHPEDMEVFVPEQFSPPPFPGMKIYQVGKKYKPLSVRDGTGMNLLTVVSDKDDRYVSNMKPSRYQGITEMHDLVIDPGQASSMENLHLFLRGWIFPTDASINYALSQSDALQVQPPVIQVVNASGNWETIDSGMSFPMGKDKTVIVDLRDKFLSDDHRLRIRTNMEIYWDEIFFSDVESDTELITNVLKPTEAEIHFRGFSKTYRKGGRYGPHWFDYSQVDKDVKWRDLEGRYTRFGDVLPLLVDDDNQYIISNAGDETSILFDAASLPEVKAGWKRDFLIHSVGWVKDGDLNTAEGHSVGPLPYHGMSAYPPSEKDDYPIDTDIKKYQDLYNTRIVDRGQFQNSLKNTPGEK